MRSASAGARARALAPALPRPGWKSAGALALLCSGVAWASLPRVTDVPTDEQQQWQALGDRAAVERRRDGHAHGADRSRRAGRVRAQARCGQLRAGQPLRLQRLRRLARVRCASAAGSATGFIGRCARPALRREVAAQYLAALATEIDVGDVAPNASFDMVLGPNRQLALRRAEPRRRRRLAAGAMGRQRPQRMDRRRQRGPARARRERNDDAGPRADHLLFRLPLSPDPALHPLPRRSRYRRELGQPDRRRRRRPHCRRRLGRRLRPRGADRAWRRAGQPLRPHERDRRRAGQLRPRRAS